MKIKILYLFRVISAFLTVFFALISFSCTFNNQDLLCKNQWDYKNIPDKRNTGADENTIFTKPNGSGFIADKFYLLFREDEKCWLLSYYKCPFLPDVVYIKDWDFSDYDFITNSAQLFNTDKKIIFENCKFKGIRNDAVQKGQHRIYLEFNHCSFSGGVNSSYLTLNDCKIGGFTSDAMNPLREVYVKNLYIYDLAHEGNQNGSHLDGIQIYGDQSARNNVVNGKWVSKLETGSISYDNVRFEIPSIYFEGNTSYVNACVMFQLEFSDVNDVSFKNLYVNGGGKWYPLYVDTGKNNERSANGESWQHQNFVMDNVMVSNNFGKIFYPKLLSDVTITNVDHHDYLFVTSVWKDMYGTVHFLVTNDTKSEKTLQVQTNNATYIFTIPHCPSNWVLGGERNSQVLTYEGLTDENGRSYKTYRWSDMPFDLEYTIPGNPDFILCTQDENQIRYESFDNRNHYKWEINSYTITVN